jgi:hypothetical protein
MDRLLSPTVLCAHCHEPLYVRENGIGIAQCNNIRCPRTAALMPDDAFRAKIRCAHCGSGILSCVQSDNTHADFICEGEGCGRTLRIARPREIEGQPAFLRRAFHGA